MDIYWYVVISILGAALGSFAAATVWRIRAQGLIAGQEDIEDSVDKKIKKIFTKHRSISEDRSLCLSCKKTIAWYDLLPIASWIILRGRCRHCKNPIGKMEIVSEVSLAAAFLVSFIVFESSIGFTLASSALFAIWLLALAVLAIQWMYDLRWSLLVTSLTLVLFILALLMQAISIGTGVLVLEDFLIGVALSFIVMPGLYYALYKVSNGQWVGLGDVYLLIPFAVLIADWQKALLLVFLANLIGSIYMIPSMISKRTKGGARIPFGPFLIAALFIVFLWGDSIVGWYLRNALVAA